MSDLKVIVIKYDLSLDHPSCVCTALVSAEGKGKLVVKVCRSKKDGGFFACLPSAKIQDQWHSVIELENSTFIKSVLAQALVSLKEIIEYAGKPTPRPEPMHFDNELPF